MNNTPHFSILENNINKGEFSDIVVYTTIYGNYDILPKILLYDPTVDYICFTDNPKRVEKQNKEGFWRIICFRPFNDPVISNRLIKIYPSSCTFNIPHYSVYIDANIDIVGDMRDFIKCSNCFSIATYDHPLAFKLDDEIVACIQAGYFPVRLKKTIQESISKFELSELCRQQECSLIVRDHQNILIEKLGCIWWSLYFNFAAKRDQIWFSTALRLTNVDHMRLGESDPRFKKLFFSHRLSHRYKPRLKQRFQRKLNQLSSKSLWHT